MTVNPWSLNQVWPFCWCALGHCPVGRGHWLGFCGNRRGFLGVHHPGFGSKAPHPSSHQSCMPSQVIHPHTMTDPPPNFLVPCTNLSERGSSTLFHAHFLPSEPR